MQFHKMTLLDVLGKIARVRLDFLSQGKILDILIRCTRITNNYSALYTLLVGWVNFFTLFRKPFKTEAALTDRDRGIR